MTTSTEDSQAAADTSTRSTNPPAQSKTKLAGPLLIAALVALLGSLPLLNRSIGPVLPGPLDSPGTLQVLAIMLVIAALAISFDVLMGFTGLMSFGHALYFALGCYATVLFTNSGNVPLWAAGLLAVALAVVVGAAINALALRTSVVGYSMVTLAFAQVFAIGVERGFFGSGGEVGVTIDFDRVPAAFVGLVNTKNSYWLALGLLVLVYAAVWWITHTRLGWVWKSIRENPLRVEVLGFNVYWYRLSAAVVASGLAALCGAVYAVVMGGADPSITTLLYSLGLVLMVVLGGRGVIWGAMLGGLLYTYATVRLTAVSGSSAVEGLPTVLRVPLEQPEFILGVLFVVVIIFFPGGLVSSVRAVKERIGRLRATR